MEIGNTEERRRQFQRLLLRLAKNQSLLDSSEEKRKIYLELEEIYQKESTKDIKRAEGFRHFYSDIFAVLNLSKYFFLTCASKAACSLLRSISKIYFTSSCNIANRIKRPI